MIEIKESEWESMRRDAINMIRFANDKNFENDYKYSGHPVPTVEEIKVMGLDDPENLRKYLPYLIMYIEKDDEGRDLVEPNKYETERIVPLRKYLGKLFRSEISLIFDRDDEE